MSTIKISYRASTYRPCGWRSANFTAIADKISEKCARVVEVIDIDGEGVVGYNHDSKRQKFSLSGNAAREVGKIKILSACTKVDII